MRSHGSQTPVSCFKAGGLVPDSIFGEGPYARDRTWMSDQIFGSWSLDRLHKLVGRSVRIQYVIDAIDGQGGWWWYRAWYDNGWREDNTHRMDHFPVKNGTQVELTKERDARLDTLFAEEVARLAANDGAVIIQSVVIQDRRRNELAFENVVVTAHDTRRDLLQPGTVTALDILLSLG